MSGVGIAVKPRIRWCWVCSRKLQGNFHRVAIGADGHEHIVHSACALRERLEVVSYGRVERGPKES